MRLAIVDLLFSWPPNGGADADLYHTALELQSLGHDVHLFVAAIEHSWERGRFDPDQLPVPASRVVFTERTFTRDSVPQRLRDAVDPWRPDAVFLTDGFFMKPYVAQALGHYPLVARYYAYELICPRDFRLFKNGAPCPNNYLRTPNVCRRCALDGPLKDEIQSWRMMSWPLEYLTAHAYAPAYHHAVMDSLRCCDVVIVYNPIAKAHLEGHHSNVHVIPGGVNVDEFEGTPAPDRSSAGPNVILMPGRAEDPSKGLDTLLDAGRRLATNRADFQIWATHSDHRLNTEWFKAVGWHAHGEMKMLYRRSDICVVPSIWEEPFGLVAVEAMACGRPVCASRAGGLQNIVVDGETGFLFDRGDGTALAERLAHLLDDPALRRRMGDAGRKRAEAEYHWRRIVRHYYPPILEMLAEK